MCKLAGDTTLRHSVQFGHGCIDATAVVAELRRQVRTERQWGEEGHRITNGLSIAAVPAPLRSFYEKFQDYYIDQHAMDADHAKNGDPNEGPRHYRSRPLWRVPVHRATGNWEDAVSKFGQATLVGRGILPWYLTETYEKLIAAFQRKDVPAVLKLSAWLGHYTGDAHVPLHTTANHNGQLTGQKGLHSYFETELLKKHVDPEEVVPAPAEHLGQPVQRLARR